MYTGAPSKGAGVTPRQGPQLLRVASVTGLPHVAPSLVQMTQPVEDMGGLCVFACLTTVKKGRT